MKTIKTIRELKNQKIGDISRVTDKDADEKVMSGYFMYVPKSEWKQIVRQKVETTDTSKENTKTLKKTQRNSETDKKSKNLKKTKQNS